MGVTAKQSFFQKRAYRPRPPKHATYLISRTTKQRTDWTLCQKYHIVTSKGCGMEARLISDDVQITSFERR